MIRLTSLSLLQLLVTGGLSRSPELSLTDTEKPIPIASVFGLQGMTGVLPCEVSQDGHSHQDVTLILWFKDNATKPMYSLDVMGRPLSQAAQWADTSSLGRRSTFRTNFQTALLIDSVTREDDGLYRCRIDYKNSPTKNVKINFTVIVPPNKPVVRTQNQAVALHGAEVGPLEVGDDLVLICEVSGGSPSPSLTWWKEGSIYDSTYDVTSYGTVVNTMEYHNLRREDLNAKFVCQGSNTNSTPPVSREVHVSLYLPPTGLEILEKPTYVSEGKSRLVTCQATGGYPPPEISWWIGTRQLQPQQSKKEYQGVATSRLVYTPAIEEDGRYLSCRVLAGGKIKESLEDTWEIKVLYKPRVSLRLGKSLDPDNLRTGNDVYFECDVKSNPMPHKLVWLHRNGVWQGCKDIVWGKQLVGNQEKGIVLTQQSLVLQKVERMSSGEYECQAFNSEGYSTSNPVELNIMYAPVCRQHTEGQILGISYKKPATILCEVSAHPAAVSFRWFFNNSEHQEWKDHADFSQSGLKSQIEFLPRTSKDYGNLYCIAENAIGVQSEPCSFQIVPTGKPSPLTGCQIINRTLHSLKVECHEGFDGGLPANFLLELYDAEKMKLLSQMTNKVPIFEVSNIDPGDSIKLYLYAENAKGTSEPAIIDDSSQNPQKHYVEGVTDFKAVKDSSTSDSPPPAINLLVITASAGGFFVFCILALCIIFTYRRKKMVYRSQSPTNQSESFYQQDNQEPQSSYYGSNPDLIPIKNYSDSGTEGHHQFCSQLDSALLLGNQRVAVKTLPGSGNAPSQSLGSPGVPPFSGSMAGQTGTLDRKLRSQGPGVSSYPLYHTCNRQQNKKKVTIVDSGGREDESKV